MPKKEVKNLEAMVPLIFTLKSKIKKVYGKKKLYGSVQYIGVTLNI